MDDTAFHYSRTLRIIMILAIVVPLVVIGGLLWYFGSVDIPPESPPPAVSNSLDTAGK
jgi:flagellar basal body-associated protein FliL